MSASHLVLYSKRAHLRSQWQSQSCTDDSDDDDDDDDDCGEDDNAGSHSNHRGHRQL